MAKFTNKNKPINLQPLNYYVVVDGKLEDYEDNFVDWPIYMSIKDCSNYIETMVLENANKPEDYSIYKLVFVGRPKPIKIEFEFDPINSVDKAT